MMIFADYMAGLSERRSLRRAVDGGKVTYRLQLQGTSAVTITVDETNPASFARVCSETWPLTVTNGSPGEFMRRALNFNRNAFHHLPCGIVQDPDKPDHFRLIWSIPPIQQNATQWNEQLRLFGKLTEKAWDTIAPGLVQGYKEPNEDGANNMIFMP